MLKQSCFSPARPRRAETRLSPCSVLASFRPATYRRRFSEIGITGGAFPFAKIRSRSERSTRSEVCTSSALHSLRPCVGQGASQGEEAVLADSGREGEISAGAGLVSSPTFLSILRESFPVVPTCGLSKFQRTGIVFLQTTRAMLRFSIVEVKRPGVELFLENPILVIRWRPSVKRAMNSP